MGNTIVFYKGFPLDRALLGRMVRCVAEDQAGSPTEIGMYLGVNTPKAQSNAFPRWLVHTGLGTFRQSTYSLTPFGTQVAQFDPLLMRQGTQWLLHYYLAIEHEVRSEVWYRFINEFASPGRQFTEEELSTYVTRALSHAQPNRDGIPKDTKELLKLYTQSKGLQAIHLLVAEQTGYRIQPQERPDILIVGYALLDFWARRYPHIDTLRFSQLCELPESIGRVFVADRVEVRTWIAGLASMGYLSFAESQHEPVNRLFKDSPTQLLKEYYAQ